MEPIANMLSVRVQIELAVAHHLTTIGEKCDLLIQPAALPEREPVPLP
jgi:hypothetical protein